MSELPAVSGRGKVDPFIVMEVMSAAALREAAGKDVLHLEVGQPATAAPKLVREAAKKALDNDLIGYTVARGIPELRERISRYYRETQGCDVAPERIVITTGSSAGFLLAFLATCDPGSAIALAEPGYPAYFNILKALSIEALSLETGIEHRFQPTQELIASLVHPVRGVLTASPANPTGTMLDEPTMLALLSEIESRNAWYISDEIYHGISYGKPCTSALAVGGGRYQDRTIVINSFSKYFSMTGWRIGWMVVPQFLVKTVERLAQNLFISAPTLSQYAAIAAFDAIEECERNVEIYGKNREVLLNELPHAGISKFAPADGAFYVYADISKYTNDSKTFCARLLDETGVATTPGVDFDRKHGHASMRFSFAGSTETMIEACSRIRNWLNSSK